MKAAFPVNEGDRLKALYDLAILDTPTDKSFDELTKLVMIICDVPIAVVSFVDKDRQWFKSCLGLDVKETHRDIAFCAHAILTPTDLLEVENALEDSRFCDNDLVTGQPGIRFYAGAPLVFQDCFALGTLCVIDYKPRKLSNEQKKCLKLLANQVVKLIELHETLFKASVQAEKFSTFYRMSPVAIALNRLDDGSFLEANPELYRMLGYEEEEFLKLNCWDITPIKYYEDEQQQLQSLKTSKRYGPYEKHYIHKNGDWIPVVLEGVLIKSYSGENQIWSVIQDITELKRAEQLKNEFVSAVSHELRTPLTSISAALRMVTGGMLGNISEKISDVVNIAYKNSQRLSLLINDLLDMEKLSIGKMEFYCESMTVLPLVKQVISENKVYADQFQVSIELTSEVTTELIRVDPQRLQQILNNFISNAIKFSRKNSIVYVQLLIKDQSKIKICVQDHGIGIDPKFQEKIFQKFSQADASNARNRGGTGLGLAISKELVERMGGSIGFSSELNNGSCFYAEFPIVNLNQEQK